MIAGVESNRDVNQGGTGRLPQHPRKTLKIIDFNKPECEAMLERNGGQTSFSPAFQHYVVLRHFYLRVIMIAEKNLLSLGGDND